MMHKGITILMVLGLIIAVQPADGQRKERDSRADAAYEAGEYFEAIDLFKKAYGKVSDKEKQAEIVYKIGECYRIIGEPRQATLWYRKALMQDYQNPELYLRYGQSLMRYGRFEEALEQFETYRDLIPDDPRGDWGIESAQTAQEWIDNPTGYIVENMRYFNTFQRDWSPSYASADYMDVYFTSTREDSREVKTWGHGTKFCRYILFKDGP
jgi:peptidoglycan-associated lipoprotein